MSLSDGLALAGFLAFVAGAALAFGPAWALMLSGALMMGVGVLAAWRRGD